MGRRILVVLFWVILIAVLAKPRATWQRLSEFWAQRSWMLGVIVTAIGIYFFYGLYTLLMR